MRRRSRLILALDVTEESKALRLAADTKDYVDAFKVNYPLVLAEVADPHLRPQVVLHRAPLRRKQGDDVRDVPARLQELQHRIAQAPRDPVDPAQLVRGLRAHARAEQDPEEVPLVHGKDRERNRAARESRFRLPNHG